MDHLAPRPAAPGRRDGPAFERASLALSFMLLAIAGWVDAVGLVRWSELYASFMSGNTVQFGASPAVGDWHGTVEAGRAVLMFLVGIVLGEVVGPAAKGWRSPVVVALD